MDEARALYSSPEIADHALVLHRVLAPGFGEDVLIDDHVHDGGAFFFERLRVDVLQLFGVLHPVARRAEDARVLVEPRVADDVGDVAPLVEMFLVGALRNPG